MSKVYRIHQCKIKASSSNSNSSQGTSSKGALNSRIPATTHSLNNSTIIKTSKSISIKARLIRPLLTSVLRQSHIHNINIKHLFSNLIRNKPNKFSRGNSATATIGSSRMPQARPSKLLKGTTLTGVALTLVRSTWVSHAYSWIFSLSKLNHVSRILRITTWSDVLIIMTIIKIEGVHWAHISLRSVRIYRARSAIVRRAICAIALITALKSSTTQISTRLSSVHRI